MKKQSDRAVVDQKELRKRVREVWEAVSPKVRLTTTSHRFPSRKEAAKISLYKLVGKHFDTFAELYPFPYGLFIPFEVELRPGYSSLLYKGEPIENLRRFVNDRFSVFHRELEERFMRYYTEFESKLKEYFSRAEREKSALYSDKTREVRKILNSGYDGREIAQALALIVTEVVSYLTRDELRRLEFRAKSRGVFELARRLYEREGGEDFCTNVVRVLFFGSVIVDRIWTLQDDAETVRYTVRVRFTSWPENDFRNERFALYRALSFRYFN